MVGHAAMSRAWCSWLVVQMVWPLWVVMAQLLVPVLAYVQCSGVCILGVLCLLFRDPSIKA